jgi:hypothetical protein
LKRIYLNHVGSGCILEGIWLGDLEMIHTMNQSMDLKYCAFGSFDALEEIK